MKKNNRKIWRYLRISFTGILFLLVLIEVFFRISFSNKLAERYFPLIFASDSLYGYTYIPHAESTKCNPAFCADIKVNNRGFPGKDFAIEKTTGVTRIMIVAASDATGFDSGNGANYPDIVSQQFRDRGENIEIVNCSIEGSERADFTVNLIRDKCKLFHADYVLWNSFVPLNSRPVYDEIYKNYVIEYFDYNTDLEKVKEFIDKECIAPTAFNIFYRTSYLFRYFCKYYTENYNSFTYKISKFRKKGKWTIEGYIKKKVVDHSVPRSIHHYSIDSSIQIIKQVQEELRKSNTKLFVFNTYSHPYSDFQKEIFSANKISFIDLNIKKKPEYIHGEMDGHSNETGQNVIASNLYRAIDSLMENEDQVPECMVEDMLGQNRYSAISLPSKMVIYNFSAALTDEAKNLATSRFKNFFDEITEISFMDEEIVVPADFFDGKKFLLAQDASICFIKTPKNIPRNFHHWMDAIKQLNDEFVGTNSILIFCNTFDPLTNNFIKYLFELENLNCINMDAAHINRVLGEGEISQYQDYLIQGFHEYLRKFNQVSGSVYNIAFKKPVYSSSSTESWGFAGEFINDGVTQPSSTSIGWRAWFNDKEQHKEWLLIDLMDVFQMQKIVIYPRLFQNKSFGFPLDFQLQCSLDSMNWNTIIEVEDYRNTAKYSAIEYNFESIEARYFRIRINKLPLVMYEIEGLCYRTELSEIEIIGRKQNSPGNSLFSK